MPSGDEGGSKRAKTSEAADIEAIINKALSASEDKWERGCQDSDDKWHKRVTELLAPSDARTDKKISEAILSLGKKTENFVEKMCDKLRRSFSSTGSSIGPGSPPFARETLSAAGTALTASVDRR